MSRGQETEARGQIVKRKAIIFCSATIAECPVEAACISTDAETKKENPVRLLRRIDNGDRWLAGVLRVSRRVTMASITIIITDQEEKGSVHVEATFDPCAGKSAMFSLAQYLGTLCVEKIANGQLAREDGLVFGDTKVEFGDTKVEALNT